MCGAPAAPPPPPPPRLLLHLMHYGCASDPDDTATFLNRNAPHTTKVNLTLQHFARKILYLKLTNKTMLIDVEFV